MADPPVVPWVRPSVMSSQPLLQTVRTRTYPSPEAIVPLVRRFVRLHLPSVRARRRLDIRTFGKRRHGIAGTSPGRQASLCKKE